MPSRGGTVQTAIGVPSCPAISTTSPPWPTARASVFQRSKR